ncbi:snorna binding protein [Moniliophthora roreri MCA 2997]|uniref:Snorna binding protein n=1 Tax=Moniliophthora roreri (strain MCA 2997) TaxID=1381753 RepID=V2XFK2_MONRO|nr:snorna binding protein [Moniliophthora roreri MCA 2997]
MPLPLPCIRTRKLPLFILNPRPLYHITVSRFGRKRGSLLLCLAASFFILVTLSLLRGFNKSRQPWQPHIPFLRRNTLVYEQEDLQRIWLWEIASGHYPSRREISPKIGLSKVPNNPALPFRQDARVSSNSAVYTTTHGVGSKRIYLGLRSQTHNAAYPPRPVPGSIVDLDILMQHCDFTQGKYVRDCLEVLRVGAGLDNGRHLRRDEEMDDWKYIFLETERSKPHVRIERFDVVPQIMNDTLGPRSLDREIPPISLPPTMRYHTYSDLSSPCDPDYPRIFHMFWTGPFTDKPYMAIISFLYTQNTGLHVDDYPDDKAACRPQFWLWINPGRAGSIPNSRAVEDLRDSIKSSPWLSPFLHDRFKDVIHFKLWNTTEQLDSIPEIRDEWRSLESVFESNGYRIKPKKQAHTGVDDADTYERVSVVLSDMVRFILCHRFGGIYLDADTIFLRDWEELWGWKGAFAYKWSSMSRYNTAVLHMNKGSALGTFIFRTALKHGLDFHPITIHRYLVDAHSEELLYKIPDALFDPGWLNVDGYQRHRPPQPYISDFEYFFETPIADSASPQALGFDGFFKGVYSYHYHNFWWKPFDPSRNWPDLGERFAASQKMAQDAINGEYMDNRDLDWSTVMKRTFEAYIRGEIPNMYGEWLKW